MVCLAIWSRRLSYHPPAEDMARLLASMEGRLPQYLPKDLVSIVHSLVVMNISPGRAWMNSFYATLRSRLVSEPLLRWVCKEDGGGRALECCGLRSQSMQSGGKSTIFGHQLEQWCMKQGWKSSSTRRLPILPLEGGQCVE